MRKEQVLRDLYQLHPGADKEKIRKAYYREKAKKAFLVLVGGLLLSCIVLLNARRDKSIDLQGRVVRPDRTKEKTLELTATIGKKKFDGFQLQVAPKNLTSEEVEDIFNEFKPFLTEYVLGENTALSEVCYSLCLVDEIPGYPFRITWSSSDYRFLTEDGSVFYETGNEEQVATAHVSYGEWEWTIRIPIVIAPLPLSEEEEQYKKLSDLLSAEEKSTRDEEDFLLPTEYEGESIVWKEQEDITPYCLMVLALAAAVLVYVFSDKDLHQKNEERRELLQKEYPFFLMKISLYMEAGLPLRSAILRVAVSYQKKRMSTHPLCTELAIVCNELSVGIPEGEVYERMGRRIDMPCYLRLSMLLSQNLRKGSNELRNRLMLQAREAVTDNLHYHKKKGEEAQTKLLVPTIALLLVVMVLVIIPAFYGMNM